ncbi:MAG: putative DNA-binding domain-containing protein [Gammaproteobacteria bacterium]|nr:putative DNA-binding domain-containing protein [Gammaproteobacteria bacterium]
MNGLRKLQEGFARSVIEGVDKNYASSICDAGISGARRLGIYQNGVAIGYRDALGGVFEVVKKLVGDDFFAHVAESYVRVHSSTSGNVHDFGESFPEYLETFLGLETLPYLSGVARLEWAYHAAFHSPVGEMLNINKLSRVSESQYEQLTLFLSPACYLLRSNYPVLRIWQVNQEDYEGDEVVDLEEGGVALAIVREGKQIAFHSLSPGAFAMLKAISVGETFNTSCQAALNIDSGCDVSKVLQDAVMNRMVVGFFVGEAVKK